MGKRNEFIQYLLDMLQEFGAVRAKAMFGGHAIYRDGIVFAIVVDNTLYIKADNNSRELFEKKGRKRFSYLRQGKECFLSYYMAPDEAVEDKDKLYFWAGKGFEAALRARKTVT